MTIYNTPMNGQIVIATKAEHDELMQTLDMAIAETVLSTGRNDYLTLWDNCLRVADDIAHGSTERRINVWELATWLERQYSSHRRTSQS